MYVIVLVISLSIMISPSMLNFWPKHSVVILKNVQANLVCTNTLQEYILQEIRISFYALPNRKHSQRKYNEKQTPKRC